MAGVQISPGELSRLSTAVINATSSSALIAGVAGTTIRVYRLLFVSTVGGTVTLANAGTAFTGPMPFSSLGAMVLDFSGEPWFSCSSGNAFSVTLGGTSITGMVNYTQEGL